MTTIRLATAYVIYVVTIIIATFCFKIARIIGGHKVISKARGSPQDYDSRTYGAIGIASFLRARPTNRKEKT